MRSEYGSGKWVGHLNTGEKAMAITRVVRDDNGGLIGSVRYLVSMERADRQISLVIFILIAAGLFIMLLLTLSGAYFIRSILVPVRQLSQSARQIAQGDFAVRIDKAKDDEIGGWAETLHEGADPDTTEKGMNVIIRESERLSGLVEELLDFSRLQNNRMRLMVSRLDILAELDEAVYMFTDRARTEEKQLNYEETTALPPVYGDVDRLRQVFVNIIDNALKYTSPGGTITVSSREDSGWVREEILQGQPAGAGLGHWAGGGR